jgi:hypothetical protein
MRELMRKPELSEMIEWYLRRLSEEWFEYVIWEVVHASPCSATKGANWTIKIEEPCSEECRAALLVIVGQMQKMYSLDISRRVIGLESRLAQRDGCFC